jgi:hypothetical protein
VNWDKVHEIALVTFYVSLGLFVATLVLALLFSGCYEGQ